MFLDLGQCFSSDEFLSHGFVFGGRVVLVRELIQGFVFAVVFMSFFDLVKLIFFCCYLPLDKPGVEANSQRSTIQDM